MREQLGPAASRDADAVTLDWVKHHRSFPRVTVIPSAAIPLFNTDECDCLDITELSVDIESMTQGMSGDPYDFQKLMVRIFSATSQNITWGDGFANSGVAWLPEITQPGKTHQIGLEYNLSQGVWRCLAADAVGV